MKNKENFLKIFLAIFFLVGISYIPSILGGNSPAQVISSIFSPYNVNPIVRDAQHILSNLGLYEGRVSGLFGIRTKESIINFQNIYGLDPNGILDEPTQNALFGINNQNSILPYTNKGNRFAGSFIERIYRVEYREVSMMGKITQNDFSMYLLRHEDRRTNFIFYSNLGEKYSIEPVSSFDFSDYLNREVFVKGFVLNSENNFGMNHIIVNPSLVESFDDIQDVDSEYQYLSNYISDTYNEFGTFTTQTGVISNINSPMYYAVGGTETSFVLYTSNDKFAIENISNFDLGQLNEQEIQVSGFLLRDLNSAGIRTIVVNYSR